MPRRWIFANGAVHYASTTIRALERGGQLDPD
jgi:hypothetical protein